MEPPKLRKRIHYLLIFFIISLLISGLTAIPLKAEIDFLNSAIGRGTFMEKSWPSMSQWITLVYHAISEVNIIYPFLAYGTDWLAFAHLVLVILFVGAIKDPIKNIWIIEFGMIACVLVIPFALIFGFIRNIPFFWRLIDCSFGVIGIIPLWLAHKYIKKIIGLEFDGSDGEG